MSQEQMPVYTPPTGDASPGNLNQYRSSESKESFQQSAQRARQVRAMVGKIITSREELAKYLAQYGMKLLTSAVEYDRSKDFITSSYILYEAHNNYLEPLAEFLTRYPDYQPSVDYIVSHL